jgi:23S rRNA (uracil1939-C5)-methyltransferase
MTIYQTKVVEFSLKGYGVIRIPDRGTYFLPGSCVGDEIKVEIPTHVKSYEKIIHYQVISPSKDRVTPECPHHGIKDGQCGGCPLMNVEYHLQLKSKFKRVEYALIKRGIHFLPNILKTIIPSKNQLAYRNRTQIKTDGHKLGYVSEGTNTLVSIDQCLILEEKLQKQFSLYKSKIPNVEWIPQDGYRWNFIEFDDDQLDVPLNIKRPFKQGNSLQNIKMKEWLHQALKDLNKDHEILELFCGSGNLTEVAAQLGFKKIWAVENQSVGVEKLKNKNLKNVSVIEANLFLKQEWKKIETIAKDVKILLIDPPREGLQEKGSLKTKFKSLDFIISISCDPESFARDSMDFYKMGFEFVEIQPIDFFPHTPKVEIMSLLKRKDV